ncbi:zinc-binding protein A33-like [Sinocyclocheilus grahami]|uniref:zinc-binding protein A33-like n=1 Tax=Sinocyclocheilus grahami TaxID=75366 RepID=UPI0007AD40B4|nr:PREDICTED: zinc-binding protein A33-like [Sinocyclocheilus grahami]
MASTLSFCLMCPVCLSDFNDPVSLPCEHVFCRQCITSYLESHEGAHKCPECRQNFTRQDLKGNRVLRNVVDVLQQQKLKTRQQTPKNTQEMLCSEHMEPLKLFCENDRKLVCLICKEGEKHCGHSFKPVKEAMEISEKVVREALRFILHDNKQMGDMILSQMLEITTSKERAKRLEEKMHVQFNKMHDFLRKKEEEMVRQLHRQASSAEVSMRQNASFLSKLQINGNNQESILESGLQMSQPERFLEWWSEKGFPLVDAITLGENKDIKSALPTKFKSRLDGTRVISDHFTLGPYETDLPLIVWRDMLGSVKQDLSDTSTIDKDLKLTIKKESHLQSQGEDYFAKFQKFHNGYKDNYVENIHPGQVYWEVDVGAEAGWEHGLTVRYYPKEKNVSVWQTLFSKCFEHISLSVKNDRLQAVRGGEETPIVTQIIPSRVGVYVDSEKRQVVFCNADNMSLLHTVWCGDK